MALIGEVIYRQFRKRLTKPLVRWIIKLLRITPQKPLYRASEQDPALVQK